MAKIFNTAISIPSKILPYKNEEIKKKMKTKFKLFENIDESEFFKQFKEIEFHKKEVSEAFLTPLRCRPNKSILKKIEKTQLLKEFDNLKYRLEKSKKNLYSAMLEEIKKSKHFLKENLYDFLMDNPTDDMKKMGVQNYQVIADNISSTVVERLPIPDPIKIIDNFNLKIVFSDLTYEDMSDQELLQELTEKKILEQDELWPLADFGKGVIIN